MMPVDLNALLDRLRAAVGEHHVLTTPGEQAAFVADWRGAYRGDALAVVRPASTLEVAAVVRACGAAGVAIVPQGGNTGMCGAAVPEPMRPSVIVALVRMNRVRAIDALDNTITVDAGCVLGAVQDAAAAVGRLFPVSLAAEGSCQIGGAIGTNAGGINVLRYGNMREQVLGVEAVMADGAIWSALRALRKDNRGYDLKQLLIGSEGTLGIVTGAVLKLYPRPARRQTVFMAVPSPDAAVHMLALLRAALADRISAYELIGRRCVDLVLRHCAGTQDPFAGAHAWYVLVDIDDDEGESARPVVEAVLSTALDDGLVNDATLADSVARARALWRLRESIPEATRFEGDALRSDVAVPVSKIGSFLDAVPEAFGAADAAQGLVCFGHVGDGNLHVNLLAPAGVSFGSWSRDASRRLYDLVATFDGSFSAEHGVGQAKRNELVRYKNPIEIDLMRRVKAALDPVGLMNPGKVLIAAPFALEESS